MLFLTSVIDNLLVCKSGQKLKKKGHAYCAVHRCNKKILINDLLDANIMNYRTKLI